MGALSPGQRLADAGVRLLYLGAALAMLWVASQRHQDFRLTAGTSADFPSGHWAIFVGSVVLVGVLLGLAAQPPAGLRGYRWWVALTLALPPAVLLAIIPLAADLGWSFPSWLQDLVSFCGESALGVMVGVAVAAGLVSKPS